jgi:hypothetical protein
MVVIDASVLRRLVLADKPQEGHALQALATANRLGLRRNTRPGAVSASSLPP